jgi:glutamyl-tRNA synthetase
MVEKFDIKDVNANPARFDIKKCDSINTDQIKLLSEAEVNRRIRPFLAAEGIVSEPATAEQEALLEELMPLVAPRLRKLTEAPGLVASFFVSDTDFTIDEAARAKVLNEQGLSVVQAAYDALAGVSSWTTADIEAALNAKLVEELELKPRVAFGPVRVATSGAQISPPLFESLEILGRERTLTRLKSALG